MTSGAWTAGRRSFPALVYKVQPEVRRQEQKVVSHRVNDVRHFYPTRPIHPDLNWKTGQSSPSRRSRDILSQIPSWFCIQKVRQIGRLRRKKKSAYRLLTLKFLNIKSEIVCYFNFLFKPKEVIAAGFLLIFLFLLICLKNLTERNTVSEAPCALQNLEGLIGADMYTWVREQFDIQNLIILLCKLSIFVCFA